VDVHVGRHILKTGLSGELGQGRTRILATHHVAVCLPETSYLVVLGDGTVLQAGSPQKLRMTENDPAASMLASPRTVIPSSEVAANGAGFQSNTSQHFDEQAKPQDAKVFVEVESREVGGVGWNVYKAYLESSGGIVFCIAAVALMCSSQGFSIGRVYRPSPSPAIGGNREC
jgi:ABC-type glutathione transport system ATPase component